MPNRRKNVDSNRIKRSAKKTRLSDYLSSAYVQYLVIFLIWGALLLINQSTEMRFEYFWPGWLFICSIYDSLKYQGLQYTIVFIIIVVTMDLICFFLFPPSWIYSCGSAYVWVYLLWHTDQGLCFLTLAFCFIFVYFEMGFYSRETRLNHSIYLFRPFAAHSIGYPVVCMGFSIKRYLDVRHRKFKELDVRRQNNVYFRILRDAVPCSAIADYSGQYSSIYLPDSIIETPCADGYDYSAALHGNKLPWSLFLLQQFGKSLCLRFSRLVFSHSSLPSKECNGISSNSTCHAYHRLHDFTHDSHGVGNGTLVTSGTAPDSATRRGQTSHTETNLTCSSSTSSQANCRRYAVDNCQSSVDAHSKGGTQLHSTKGGRYVKEDPITRLENNLRRLRSDVQSMRAVESQLRNQLTQLERGDRLNRLSLSEQRQKNESLSAEISKLTALTRTERANLASVEQSLAEEKRLRQTLEVQLSEEPVLKEEHDVDANALSTFELATSTGQGNSVQVSTPDDMDTSSSQCTVDLTEASCCQQRRVLEIKLSALRATSRQRDEQLRILSGARARQANHNQQQHELNRNLMIPATNSRQVLGSSAHESKKRLKSSPLSDFIPEEDVTEEEQQQPLEARLQRAVLEGERLNSTLRQENWMKQELLTSYHNSVREINDLSKTHKQRDFQILELTMKIEQLERLASSVSMDGRVNPVGLERDAASHTEGFSDKPPTSQAFRVPSSMTFPSVPWQPKDAANFRLSEFAPIDRTCVTSVQSLRLPTTPGNLPCPDSMLTASPSVLDSSQGRLFGLASGHRAIPNSPFAFSETHSSDLLSKSNRTQTAAAAANVQRLFTETH
ncbi:unnamed protein product [Dicrocoelium dendriticum]|nr:unnamed protein product [Dicrocoelium dendriticum]